MQVTILDNQSDTEVPAHLLPMTPDHLEEATATWNCEFYRRRDAGLRDEDILVWQYGLMREVSDDDFAQDGYVLEATEAVQGVLLLEGNVQRSRLVPEANALYVRYVATAPWNRPGIYSMGLFRRVGHWLTRQAAAESVRRGCQGRIGLHSFPGATDFYERLGFEKCGHDASKRGMAYFELRSGMAKALFEQGAGCDADPGPQFVSAPRNECRLVDSHN